MRTNKKLFLLFTFIFINTGILFSQSNYKKLVLSEVYFNKSNPQLNWIEIYNPTMTPLNLEKIRLSYLRTENILPEFMQKRGGFEIKPGSRVVFVANKKIFASVFNNKVNTIGVPALSLISQGGFLAISTKGEGQKGIDGFRFGSPILSVKVESQLGAQVLGMEMREKSFSRIIKIKNNKISIGSFREAMPTPGK